MQIDRFVVALYLLVHLAACGIIAWLYGPIYAYVGLCLPLMAELYLLLIWIAGGSWLMALPALLYLLLIPLGPLVGGLGSGRGALSDTGDEHRPRHWKPVFHH